MTPGQAAAAWPKRDARDHAYFAAIEQAAIAAREPDAPGDKRDPLACPCCVFGTDDCWCRTDCGVERCQAREPGAAPAGPSACECSHRPDEHILGKARRSGILTHCLHPGCGCDLYRAPEPEPQPAPRLVADTVGGEPRWEFPAGPQPAPGLAAMPCEALAADNARLREQLAATKLVLQETSRESSQRGAGRDDYAARLKAVDQSWAKLAVERDKFRELLDEVGVMAANAPEDGDCFAVCEEIAMRAAAAGVPDAEPAAEVRTCYCGTTAAVVPGSFPHDDCDGSAPAPGADGGGR
jgi:hypothetical protein